MEDTLAKAVLSFSPPGFSTSDKDGNRSYPFTDLRRCAEILHRPDRGHIKQEERMALRNLLRLFTILCFYTKMKGTAEFWANVAEDWQLPGQNITSIEARKVARFYRKARREYLKQIKALGSAKVTPDFTTTGLQLIQAVDFWNKHRKREFPTPQHQEAEWTKCRERFNAVNKNSLYTIGRWFPDTLQKLAQDLDSGTPSATGHSTTAGWPQDSNVNGEDSDVVFVHCQTKGRSKENDLKKKGARKRKRMADDGFGRSSNAKEKYKKSKRPKNQTKPVSQQQQNPGSGRCIHPERARNINSQSRSHVYDVVPSSGAGSGPFMRGGLSSDNLSTATSSTESTTSSTESTTSSTESTTDRKSVV